MKRKAINDKAYCPGVVAETLERCEKREECARWTEHYEFDENKFYHYTAADYCIKFGYFSFMGFDETKESE